MYQGPGGGHLLPRVSLAYQPEHTRLRVRLVMVHVSGSPVFELDLKESQRVVLLYTATQNVSELSLEWLRFMP